MNVAWQFPGFLKLLLAISAIALISACDKPKPADKLQSAGQNKAVPEKMQKPMPQCVEAKDGGPEEVVRTIYNQYPFAGRKVIKNEPKEVLEKYLDEKFTAVLLMDYACEENTGGVCAIDSDIMYNAQDAEIADLKVCQMNPARRTVTVNYRNFGEPNSSTYQLANTPSGWRISDIVSPAENDPYSFTADLEKTFQDLTKAWEKAQGTEQIKENVKNKQPLPQCERAKPGGPEDMVRSLYDQYPWKGDRIIINEPKEMLQKYFDITLVEMMVDNQARGKKGKRAYQMPNIIINHDMYDSQNISGFRICAMDATSKTVRVQFRDDGEPRMVIYKLVEAAAGWRISDVIYLPRADQRDLDSPEGWSILGALSPD